mgnify:FL=1
MGKPTVMQEVRQLYCIYKIQLREGKQPVYRQISGTGQRRWRMIKEAERYLDYARVDWENGILDVEGYQIEVQTVNAIRNTILQCYTEVPEEQNGEKVEN